MEFYIFDFKKINEELIKIYREIDPSFEYCFIEELKRYGEFKDDNYIIKHVNLRGSNPVNIVDQYFILRFSRSIWTYFKDKEEYHDVQLPEEMIKTYKPDPKKYFGSGPKIYNYGGERFIKLFDIDDYK